MRRDAMQWFWEQYNEARVHRAELRRCAAAAEEQLAGLFPALVIAAEADVLRDGGEAYGVKLRAVGVARVSPGCVVRQPKRPVRCGRIAAVTASARVGTSSTVRDEMVIRMPGGEESRKRAPGATAQPACSSRVTAPVSSGTGTQTFMLLRP